MASDAAKMFGCPVCGFRVSPQDEACPRCGNPFSGSTKFECPFCGELVERGAKECPSCHVNYSDFREKSEARGGDDDIDALLMEIIKLESTSVKSEDKRLSCPDCSWMLDGSETRCPKCGRSFEEDVTFQCPVCGSTVSDDADKCPECGAIFVGEEEEARASEHEQVSSALDEIMGVAEREPAPDSTREKATEPAEPEPTEPAPVVTRVSSIFDKIVSVVKEDTRGPTPQPQPAGQPEPVPQPEAPREPEPAPEPAPEAEVAEPVERPEPEAAPAAGPEAAPKKTKRRKLKAKPKGS